MSERRGRIHEKHDLSKTRRCELLDVPRSSAYYRRESVSEADLAVMRLIDEIHLQLRIPVKPITESGVKPITESGQVDHLSERSDAGVRLCRSVIGLGQ